MLQRSSHHPGNRTQVTSQERHGSGSVTCAHSAAHKGTRQTTRQPSQLARRHRCWWHTAAHGGARTHKVQRVRRDARRGGRGGLHATKSKGTQSSCGGGRATPYSQSAGRDLVPGASRAAHPPDADMQRQRLLHEANFPESWGAKCIRNTFPVVPPKSGESRSDEKIVPP